MELFFPNRDAVRYRIQVGGHLAEHWANWFDGMALTWDADGATTLVGQLRDQATLHGILTRIRDLRLNLIMVECLDDAPT